jgi:flagellar assembly factor FliW
MLIISEDLKERCLKAFQTYRLERLSKKEITNCIVSLEEKIRIDFTIVKPYCKFTYSMSILDLPEDIQQELFNLYDLSSI